MRQGDAAEWCGVNVRTLERWRLEGNGPRFRKHGRAVVYFLEDLEEWSAARLVGSTTEAKALEL